MNGWPLWQGRNARRREGSPRIIKHAEPNQFILAPRDQLNYFDIQAVDLPRPITALEAWNHIMSRPQPLLRAAFWLRDAVSSLFGVKKIKGFSTTRHESVAKGDYLDFFLVEHAAPDMLWLTERDRHLDVLTCVSVNGRRLSIVSSVEVHNLFGKLYMVPVGIAHRWIVRRMLKRLGRDLA